MNLLRTEIDSSNAKKCYRRMSYGNKLFCVMVVSLRHRTNPRNQIRVYAQECRGFVL